MSTITVTKANGELEVFEKTMGHQIGNGAVQVMNEDGTQVVFNNFQEVHVDLDDEEKTAFKKRITDVEEQAKARMAASEAKPEEGVPVLEAVPLNS